MPEFWPMGRRGTQVWGDLDKRFRSPVKAYFSKRVNDRNEAEDLTQEVFVRLSRHPDKNNGENIEAYVFKIASSVLRDWARYQSSRQKNAHSALIGVCENAITPSVLTEDRTPERVLMAKEALRDIEKALSELSKRTREIFLLSRLEHVHHRDIAVLHGISVSAVEKHVLKAIAHLSARAYRP